MKTTEYLDLVKQHLELPSDYACAKALGISPQSITHFRSGSSSMGIETCMKVGEILQIDGHAVYAQGQIERAKKPEIAEFWQSISEKFSASFNALRSGRWLGEDRRRDYVRRLAFTH